MITLLFIIMVTVQQARLISGGAGGCICGTLNNMTRGKERVTVHKEGMKSSYGVKLMCNVRDNTQGFMTVIPQHGVCCKVLSPPAHRCRIVPQNLKFSLFKKYVAMTDDCEEHFENMKQV